MMRKALFVAIALSVFLFSPGLCQDDYKPEFIPAPLGGLNFTLPSTFIQNNEMPDCNNVTFKQGLVQQRYGYNIWDGSDTYSLPLDHADSQSDIMGLVGFENYNGNNYLLAFTEDLVFNFITTTGWASIQGSADSFTGTDEEFWSTDSILKSTEDDLWLIATNGADTIIYWTGSGDINYLTGHPGTAKYLFEFERFLVTINTTESGKRYPQRVRWSDRGDPTNWTGGLSGFATLSGEDPIVGGLRFRNDFAVILKENSIWDMRRIGSSLIFNIRPVSRAVGCASGRTAQIVKDNIIYLGIDGNVYAYDGVSSKAIGDKIQPELSLDINPNKLSKCFAVDVREFQEYWLFYPSAGSDYCDKVYIFNYFYNSWTRGSLAHNMTAATQYTDQQSLTWGELQGTWAQQNWRWGDRTLNALAPIIIYGDKDGHTYSYRSIYTSDSGSAITAYFDSKDYAWTQFTRRQFVNRYDAYYEGDSISILISPDLGQSFEFARELGPDTGFMPPQKVYFRSDNESIRFRLYNDTTGFAWRFRHAVAYWQPSGELGGGSF